MYHFLDNKNPNKSKDDILHDSEFEKTIDYLKTKISFGDLKEYLLKEENLDKELIKAIKMDLNKVLLLFVDKHPSIEEMITNINVDDDSLYVEKYKKIFELIHPVSTETNLYVRTEK